MVIRYGDSVRAYGLGILLALLTIGAMWRLIESFTLRRVIVALVIAVLSVQSVYFNAVLLFALCLTAATVMLRRRQIVQALTVLAIGGIAAASLLPYVPTMKRVRSCSFMWQEPFTVSGMWTKAAETLGSPLPFRGWFWLILLTTAVVIGLWAVLRKPATTEEVAKEDRLLFALLGTFARGDLLYWVSQGSWLCNQALVFCDLRRFCCDLHRDDFRLGGTKRESSTRALCLRASSHGRFPGARSASARRTSNKCRYHRRETREDRYTG